jgi:hypothetical protein
LEELDGDEDFKIDSCTQKLGRTSCNGGQTLDKETMAAFAQQKQSWQDLGHEAAAIVDMSIYSLLSLIIEDCVYGSIFIFGCCQCFPYYWRDYSFRQIHC